MKNKINNLISGILLIGMLFGMFLVGWFGNEIYKTKTNQRELDGLYLRNWNYTRVKDYTEERDTRGDWVCVNIRNMDWNRAVEVIQHEVGHEIFAEECEKNITKCMGVIGK